MGPTNYLLSEPPRTVRTATFIWTSPSGVKQNFRLDMERCNISKSVVGTCHGRCEYCLVSVVQLLVTRDVKKCVLTGTLPSTSGWCVMSFGCGAKSRVCGEQTPVAVAYSEKGCGFSIFNKHLLPNSSSHTDRTHGAARKLSSSKGCSLL